MAVVSGTRIGVYDISAPIGEGGMGQVYRGTDTTLGRQVVARDGRFLVIQNQSAGPTVVVVPNCQTEFARWTEARNPR